MIGTHVAVGGGLVKVGLAEAVEVGAEVIQLFAGNPRSWVPRAADPVADAAFRDGAAELGLAVVVHAPHLINLGSPSEAVLSRSVAALEETLRRAVEVGAGAVVVHAGSAVAPGRRTAVLGGLHEVIGRILDRADPGVRLLIEPTAGAGEALASGIESAGEYLEKVDDERVGLCLDTCHLHAAGEDLTVLRVAADLRPRIGLIHVNDSRDPRGSHRDRHESLGEGTIGLVALESFLEQFHEVPLLVETPTHARDVALLKTFREKAKAAPAGVRGRLSEY